MSKHRQRTVETQTLNVHFKGIVSYHSSSLHNALFVFVVLTAIGHYRKSRVGLFALSPQGQGLWAMLIPSPCGSARLW